MILSRAVLRFVSLVLLACLPFAAAADTPFDGLYKPRGYDWSCAQDDLGLDGGALGVVNGYLEGVENSCRLTAPRQSGAGISYAALCEGEGTQYQQNVTLAPTGDGISVTRDGLTSYWSRCDRGSAARPTVRSLVNVNCSLPISRGEVVLLQRRLEGAGFDAGGQDGLIGRGTRRAIGAAEQSFGALAQIDGCIDTFEGYVLAQMMRAKRMGVQCQLPPTLAQIDTDILDWFVAEGHLASYSADNQMVNAIAFMRASVTYEDTREAKRASFIDRDCWLSRAEWDSLRAQRSSEEPAARVPSPPARRPAPSAETPPSAAQDAAEEGENAPAPDAAALQRQLSAALAAMADMRETWASPKDRDALEDKLEAANAEIAKLQGEVVSLEEHEALQRQLAAANQALADQAGATVPVAELDEAKRQLSAANASIADLTERLDVVVPRAASLQQALTQANAAVNSLQGQRDALNATLADLSQSTISLAEHAVTLRQLDAVGAAHAELQQRLEDEYVPKSDHAEVLRQMAALNETVALLTERTEMFRSRWLDSQRVYDAFMQECRDNPICAGSMELE